MSDHFPRATQSNDPHQKKENLIFKANEVVWDPIKLQEAIEVVRRTKWGQKKPKRYILQRRTFTVCPRCRYSESERVEIA